jgi:hypothetical protein
MVIFVYVCCLEAATKVASKILTFMSVRSECERDVRGGSVESWIGMTKEFVITIRI